MVIVVVKVCASEEVVDVGSSSVSMAVKSGSGESVPPCGAHCISINHRLELVSTHSISSVTKSGCLLPPSNRTMSTTGGGCDWCHRGRCASRTALETVLRTDRLDTRHSDHKSHQVKLGKAKRVDRNAH